jgi:hypothetical protein
MDKETQDAIDRMRAYLACDALDRSADPYRGNRDLHDIDLFLIRDQCLKDHEQCQEPKP